MLSFTIFRSQVSYILTYNGYYILCILPLLHYLCNNDHEIFLWVSKHIFYYIISLSKISLYLQ